MKCDTDTLLSNFAFKFNLRRCNKDVVRVNPRESVRLWVAVPRSAAGQYVWWGSIVMTFKASPPRVPPSYFVCLTQ